MTSIVSPPIASLTKDDGEKVKDESADVAQEYRLPEQPGSRAKSSPTRPFNDLLAGMLVEEDQALIIKIYSKLEQVSDADRMKQQLIILYSGMSSYQTLP
jgi:hypothetical protein